MRETSPQHQRVITNRTTIDPAGYVLGVDGGGSKTIAWLARLGDEATDTPLGIGLAGPSNPQGIGFENAQSNLTAAILDALNQGQPGHPLEAICLGLSGIGRPDECERMLDFVTNSIPAGKFCVTHDAEIVLAAGSDSRVGMALICGTGSLAWGRNRAGDTARTGGWGYLLGDEGSGYALAIEALRAVARHADGRGPATQLLPMLLEKLEVARPTDLVQAIYRSGLTRDRLATLATVVLDAASHDVVAAEIVRRSVEELGLMLQTLAFDLGFQASPFDLVLTGGVIVNSVTLRNLLLAHLDRIGLAPARLELVSEPVRGALAIARGLR